MNANEYESLSQAHLATCRALILDSSLLSGRNISFQLENNGVSAANIFFAHSYEEAKKVVLDQNPNLVLFEYQLGDRYWFELIQKFRDTNQFFGQALLILTTENASQATVARAVEEDLDGVVIKPYTRERFKKVLLSAVISRFFPSEYIKTIEHGKNELQFLNMEGAGELFTKAKQMSSEPTLACYYLGQVHILKSSYPQAQKHFEEGLSFNQFHYKCLTGLFDVLYVQKKYDEAYQFVKEITKYYPANLDRLASSIRLAILTRKYQDIETYYNHFTELEPKNNEIIRYVCSGLIVCGKNLLQTNQTQEALSIFEKAAYCAGQNTQYFKYIVKSLFDAQLSHEARRFLDLYPPSYRTNPDYHEMSQMILEKRGEIVELPILTFSLSTPVNLSY